MSSELYRYRVRVASVSGPYEQYDGYVAVVGYDEDDAAEAAKRRLRQTSFPDRTADMWRILEVERIY